MTSRASTGASAGLGDLRWAVPVSADSLASQVGLRRARSVAVDQSLVAGRRQLYAAGVPRWLLRRELRVGRWQRTGRQTVALHNGPLDARARRWVALLELGPRAALAGVTALQEGGLGALTDAEVHVLVPQGAERRRLAGVVRHESRRWREEDLVTTGPRRTKPAVSAVHAALWARTERQASFFLTLVVQQGLCTPAQLAEALEAVKRHRYRKALWTVVEDVAGGVRSIGELDLTRGLRRRGLPMPTRQSVKRRPDGTVYLDTEFAEYALSVESDGKQHFLPWAQLDDLARDLHSISEGNTVVRIPLLAWRLDEERVLDGLEVVFRSRGWVPAAA